MAKVEPEALEKEAASLLQGFKLNTDNVKKVLEDLKSQSIVTRIREWHENSVGDMAFDVKRLNLAVDKEQRITNVWLG